jgi:phosphatidylglycerophosphate synthase
MRDNVTVTNPARPKKPSVAQVRAVTQPAEILNRANSEHWLNDVYLRKVSVYLTRHLIMLNVSPNQVTMVMIAIGKLAALSLLIQGIPGALIAAVLAQYQMIWDCSDGEVARWQEKYSPAGIFLDKVAHYTVEGLIPVTLGIRAAGGISIFGDEATSWWPWYGALLSVVILWNKAMNDAVHVARSHSGLEKLADVKAVSAPNHSLLRSLRKITRVFPFQRIFHSIEMTMIILVAAVIDSVRGDLRATQITLLAMLTFAIVTLIGHFISIMSSSRLR